MSDQLWVDTDGLAKAAEGYRAKAENFRQHALSMVSLFDGNTAAFGDDKQGRETLAEFTRIFRARTAMLQAMADVLDATADGVLNMAESYAAGGEYGQSAATALLKGTNPGTHQGGGGSSTGFPGPSIGGGSGGTSGPGRTRRS